MNQAQSAASQHFSAQPSGVVAACRVAKGAPPSSSTPDAVRNRAGLRTNSVVALPARGAVLAAPTSSSSSSVLNISFGRVFVQWKGTAGGRSWHQQCGAAWLAGIVGPFSGCWPPPQRMQGAAAAVAGHSASCSMTKVAGVQAALLLRSMLPPAEQQVSL